DKKIYIDLVRQKSKIIVDEEGTEAAAVTEVIMTEGCALIEDKPIEVRFDRPFLYMIMDMDKNIPLFIGILDEPVTE
ncbi:MAG: serine proteinase inhibitor, partial [Lachnospiraceae bacterium]|nr:serine proteinase inhibitor [Lachnospiraceae bacterium]